MIPLVRIVLCWRCVPPRAPLTCPEETTGRAAHMPNPVEPQGTHCV